MDDETRLFRALVSRDKTAWAKVYDESSGGRGQFAFDFFLVPRR
jgi:hypothetical protein